MSDNFRKLKYIAYCRTHGPPKDVPTTLEDVVNYARWQICKARGLLFNDPIFDKYTPEEILIEHFSIEFDNSQEKVEEFKSQGLESQEERYDWFDKMEAKLKAEQSQENLEFEDSY